MNVFKTDSPLEQKLQKVEALLRELNLQIDFDGYQMNVSSSGNGTGYVMDLENKDNSFSLPRFVDSERLVVTD